MVLIGDIGLKRGFGCKVVQQDSGYARVITSDSSAKASRCGVLTFQPHCGAPGRPLL